MRKIGLISLGLLILYYCLTFTSVERKYKILNEIIKDNDFRLDTICNQFDDVVFFDDNLVDFAVWDKLSAQTQKLTNKLYKIRENTIRYSSAGSDTLLVSVLDSDCSIEYKFLYRISLPVVSSDGKTALVKITENCNCGLGGQGGEYLFKMIEGKWVMTNQFNSWIS